MGDRHGRVVLDDAIHAKQVLGPVDAFGGQLKGVHWKGDVPLISMWLCLPGRAEEDADQASRHTDHHATCLPRIPSEQNRARLPANQSYPANPLSDDVVRVHPEMPQLAFHHEFLGVGAFAAVKGGFVQKVLAHTDERQVADPLKIIARPGLKELGVDLTRTGPVLDAAHTAVRGGILDYMLIVAHKQ